MSRYQQTFSYVELTDVKRASATESRRLLHILYKSTFSKRDTLAARDHEVVEHAHINQCQCLVQPAGEHLVRTAGFRDTGWVIVEKDHGGRVHLQGLLHDDARMDRGTIDGALKQLAHSDDPMPVVQEQTSEYLVAVIGQAKTQKIPRLAPDCSRFSRRDA